MTPTPEHSPYRCFVLNAERLENDGVWSRTSRLLAAIERRGGRVTLFVHRYPASSHIVTWRPGLCRPLNEVTRSPSSRISTHDQEDGKPRSGKPQTDLSIENVR